MEGFLLVCKNCGSKDHRMDENVLPYCTHSGGYEFHHIGFGEKR